MTLTADTYERQITIYAAESSRRDNTECSKPANYPLNTRCHFNTVSLQQSHEILQKTLTNCTLGSLQHCAMLSMCNITNWASQNGPSNHRIRPQWVTVNGVK